MLTGKLEIVHVESASKDRDRWSYGRQFHIAGVAQRKARDSILVWDEHGSSCLPSAEDLSARR